MKKKHKTILSLALGAAALLLMPLTSPGQIANAAGTAFRQTIEFEDAANYASDGDNRIESAQFANYSGNGYLYLTSGWGDVSFTVPHDGQYKITIVSNADTYKENYLYLDDNSAGTLRTNGNCWEAYTQTVYLSAGTHKYGVSTNWGYTALDYVTVEAQDSQPSANGMYVSNGRLYSADGREFVMRGVNVAHAWYPDETQTSINAIADRGANCVRVVLADGTQWGKTPRSEVERIISWCESRGLVCILEVHDHTGFDDVSRLNTAVDYWLEIKDLLNAHQNYIIVNIANEWLGTWNNGAAWTSAYQSAIRTLRNAGVGNVLMVDTSGYGQETSTCISNSQNVVSADSTGNTMISIHMYSVAGKDTQTVTNNINSMVSTGVCFCIGEFGDSQNGGDVDETTIMRLCTDKNIGYAAWSWKGNSGIDTSLDMANDWQGSSLTNWGNYVFYADGIGIRDTSRSAY